MLGLKVSVRDASKLIVNEGKYLLERLFVTLFPLEEEPRDLARPILGHSFFAATYLRTMLCKRSFAVNYAGRRYAKNYCKTAPSGIYVCGARADRGPGCYHASRVRDRGRHPDIDALSAQGWCGAAVPAKSSPRSPGTRIAYWATDRRG